MKNLILIITVVMSFNSETLGQDNKLITDLSINHLVKYPDSYSAKNTEKRYPLILALHGHGSN